VNEKTTSSLMKALSSMYQKPSASNKVHLMRRLFTLWITEDTSIAQHINELNIFTTQLSSFEMEFDDEVRALIILSSLVDSWSATITTMSSSSGSTKITFFCIIFRLAFISHQHVVHVSPIENMRRAWRCYQQGIHGLHVDNW
jgi:hypothetical protein